MKLQRRTERKHLFRLTFQLDFLDIEPLQIIELYTENQEDINGIDYIESSFVGIHKKLTQIDRLIANNLKGWSIDRLNKVDLAIMRLAVYEIMFSDIPSKVAVNEAVEIAREFSTDEGPLFINGFLAVLVED